MYMQIVIFLCAIALIQPQIVKSENNSHVETKYAVDIKTVDNLHITFPYFSSDIQSVDAGMRESIRNVGIKIMEYLDNLIEEMLRNPKSTLSIFRCIGVSKDLYGIIGDVPSDHEAANDALGKSSGFKRYIKEMLCRIVREAKVVEEQLIAARVPHNHAELKEEMHMNIRGVIESLKKSPVGIYLAWTDGNVNGVRVEAHAIELIGRLRYHGYARLLNTLEWLMTIVRVFSF